MPELDLVFPVDEKAVSDNNSEMQAMQCTGAPKILIKSMASPSAFENSIELSGGWYFIRVFFKAI